MLDFAVTSLQLLYTLENVPQIKMQTSKCLYFHAKCCVVHFDFNVFKHKGHKPDMKVPLL